ncbi:hypothetical protein [Luteolibacter sp. Populi]|uniref:hypothetical protein n=1 Tax=Luteolibacter sp. Populi TaxID=3230487 RepID=UPI003465DEA5
MAPSFQHEPDEETFHYRRHPTPYDWFFLFVSPGPLVVTLRAAWRADAGSLSFVDLLPLLVVAMAIANFFRKRTLKIGHDSFSHETPWGRKEVIRFSRIGEVIESGFDLCLVHPVKSEWIRLCLLKGDFKADEWPRIVTLLTSRIRTGAPTAQISILKSD